MRDSAVKRILTKLGLTGEPDLIRLEIGQPKSWSSKYPDVPAPDSKLSIQLVAAAWASHDVYGEEMPSIAASLIESGLDSPALRRLAAETSAKCSADVADLVAKMFREFNVPCPLPEKQARLIITRQIAREVIAGERDLERAADYLETVIWGPDWNPPNENLGTIFALYDERKWDPEHQRFGSLITEDLLDAFARLARLTDKEILT
jgi:hypothetical protein